MDYSRRTSMWFVIFIGLCICFALLMSVLDIVGADQTILRYLFFLLPIAVFIVVGIWKRAAKPIDFFVAGREVPARFNSLALLGAWMSVTLFLGWSGLVYNHGMSALAIGLGWIIGLAVSAVLFVPFLRKLGAVSLTDFFALRYGRVTRWFGVIILFVCLLCFLVAQIHAGALVTASALEIDIWSAIILLSLVIVFCTIFGGMRALTFTQSLQFIVVFLAFVAPISLVSWQEYRSMLAPLSHGQVLAEIAVLEEQLEGISGAGGPGALNNKPIPADRPETQPADRAQPADHAVDAGSVVQRDSATAQDHRHTAALTGGALFNFIAVLISLAFGTAAMPHLIGRALCARSVYSARRTWLWATILAAIIVCVAPVYAGFAKLTIYESAISTDWGALSKWSYGLGSFSDTEACGADAKTLYQALARCAGLTEVDGVTGYGALHAGQRPVIMVFPELYALPFVFQAMLAAGAMAAAISTASAGIFALSVMLGHDIYGESWSLQGSMQRRILITRVGLVLLVILIGLLAANPTSLIITLAASAFSLVAASIFPILVLGIWWRRATEAGALAGMAAGLLTSGIYSYAVHAQGIDPWLEVGIGGAAIFGVPVAFAVAIGVSLYDGQNSSDAAAVIAKIRIPRGQIVTEEIARQQRQERGSASPVA